MTMTGICSFVGCFLLSEGPRFSFCASSTHGAGYDNLLQRDTGRRHDLQVWRLARRCWHRERTRLGAIGLYRLRLDSAGDAR